MTVVFRNEAEARFTVNEVMWAKPALVKAIVRQALIGQTEATIDMAIDSQSQMEKEELTRDGLQVILGDVKLTAEDFLEDILSDLKTVVLAEIRAAKYGAIVTGIKYDLAGDITDIEVDVSVS